MENNVVFALVIPAEAGIQIPAFAGMTAQSDAIFGYSRKFV